MNAKPTASPARKAIGAPALRRSDTAAAKISAADIAEIACDIVACASEYQRSVVPNHAPIAAAAAAPFPAISRAIMNPMSSVRSPAIAEVVTTATLYGNEIPFLGNGVSGRTASATANVGNQASAAPTVQWLPR